MVDFKKLSTQAKDLVEKRGGTDALKKDAAELREIAKGKGSLSDKAKAAAAALKESGAKEPAKPPPQRHRPRTRRRSPTRPRRSGRGADAERSSARPSAARSAPSARPSGDDPAA